MQRDTLTADLLLLLTALIWGFAFAAQRMGNEFVGPFTYNGIRFALGAVSLVPVIRWLDRRSVGKQVEQALKKPFPFWVAALLAGLVLFGGASLQQVALVYTTAGKAGFITGLYVVIVPIIGLFLGQHAAKGHWFGAMCAVLGLYFLSVTDSFTLAPGDGMVLLGAFFWAGHVVMLSWLAPRFDAVRLACGQFVVCAVIHLIIAFFTEELTMAGLRGAAWPIIYGGAVSVGVAYTLQVVAQRRANPAHAAVLLSMETVFAAFGGWLFLSETLGPRGLIGCGLMLAGMLVSQRSDMKAS
ncbi:EamA family transporter [Oceanidesulfovibrio indonesiensis]|uniref:EamA family transporter n=1 Tax=Oceanidesulfovibrio indonesiensis TaxID=54767 RepID=A0A7M3ME25_9BACT|nr:DMT family transporter [Oceanidesulfovibrio indonesiensis]TVM16956.1 EamA family transporter [Oceanidesulfovibrio indonesiensis]